MWDDCLIEIGSPGVFPGSRVAHLRCRDTGSESLLLLSDSHRPRGDPRAGMLPAGPSLILWEPRPGPAGPEVSLLAGDPVLPGRPGAAEGTLCAARSWGSSAQALALGPWLFLAINRGCGVSE